MCDARMAIPLDAIAGAAMCKLSDALIASINFLPDETRLIIMENYRAQLADYQGSKIAGYIPIDRTKEHCRMRQLFAEGKSIRAIAKIMQCAQKTVRKVVKAHPFLGV